MSCNLLCKLFLDVDAANSHGKCDRRVNEANEPVFLDEFSSVDAGSKRDDGDLHNCGILPCNCLSCLSSTDQRSLCFSPPNSTRKKFQIGQKVLLFNSRLKLITGKLRSRWDRPLVITNIFLHDAVEIKNEVIGKVFKVNGQQLKLFH